jgi:Zn-dependent protease with chaperone function
VEISGRAARATALLVGFYLMGFGLLALLLVVDIGVVMAGLTDHGGIKILFASLIAAVPIVRGIFFTRGNRMRKPPGVLLTPAQEPVLWQRVTHLARQIGTRPPREIRLTADVNASVHEDSRLLGLLPGKRRMFLGVPLLIGLTPAQLDAVLAHELGHYSHQDTRLAGLIHRGRASMVNTIRLYAKTTGPGGVLYQLYRRYAEHYLRTTEAISRQQELAADLASARIAGRDNAAGALRQLPALDAGFGFYLDHYAGAGRQVGLRPTAQEFLGGLHRLLADPARAAELDAIRRNLPQDNPTPYDSHPPLAQRVAAIEALPDDFRGGDGGTAMVLLRHPASAFAAAAGKAWSKETAGLQEADWATLMHASSRARALTRATPLLHAVQALTGTPGTLLLALDLIDAGRVDELAARLPEPEAARGSTGRLRAQHLRTELAAELRALGQVTLADAGRGGWPCDWSAASRFSAAGYLTQEQFADDLDDAASAAVALAPSTASLRSILAGTPTPQPTSAD